MEKKPDLLTQSEAFIAWLSSNICKPWDGIFEVRVCCLLPQRLTGKTARWKRAQTPQVSRADKHTWANSESCTQPSARQRRDIIWEKGKAGCFLCWLVVFFFIFIFNFGALVIFSFCDCRNSYDLKGLRNYERKHRAWENQKNMMSRQAGWQFERTWLLFRSC